MKDIPLKGKMVDLARVFKEKGKNSSEFYDQVKNFIAYVQVRFLGKVDEDLQQVIYLRLQRSFEYYDGKTNIATWVFSVARHQVSSHIYHQQKRNKESEDGLENIEDGSDPLMVLKSREDVEDFLDSFHNIAVEPEFDLYEDMEKLSVSSTLVKAFIWFRLRLMMG